MPSIFDNIETTNNRQYNANNIADINAALWFLPSNQRADIIGTIIEESGGNPLSVSSDGKFQGLMQWGTDRYRIKSKNEKEELNNQIEYLINSINNTY